MCVIAYKTPLMFTEPGVMKLFRGEFGLIGDVRVKLTTRLHLVLMSPL